MLFDAYEKLADVLSMKSYLGVKTRKAYKEKNIKELKKLIMEFKTLIKKLEVFYASYQKMWCSVNKPHGFDILDIRIGGVIRRVKSCITRLSAYVKGEITEIPELNEKIIEAQLGAVIECDALATEEEVRAMIAAAIPPLAEEVDY